MKLYYIDKHKTRYVSKNDTMAIDPHGMFANTRKTLKKSMISLQNAKMYILFIVSTRGMLKS